LQTGIIIVKFKWYQNFNFMKKVLAIAALALFIGSTSVYAGGGDKEKKSKKSKSEKSCCASKEAKSCAGKAEAGKDTKSCHDKKEKAL
jgi:hypothetical protein